MSAIIIDGKKTAAKIKEQLKFKVDLLKQKGCIPHLSVVLVGEDPASKVYVGMKQRASEKLGMSSETIKLDENTTEEYLLKLVDRLNKDDKVHGILVQMPLPKQIDSSKVIEAIRPEKDVDGFHPVNRGRLVSGEDCFVPCTPAGMQELLLDYGFDPAGKHVVVVGRSGLVGMPFFIMMAQKKKGANATVTICHTGSGDLKPFTQQADILIAAAGRPNTITADMVKDGVVVIDVGVNRVDDLTAEKGYRLAGDVDFESVKEKAAAITPVPGGVGPMTIAMLLKSTIKAAENLSK
jgi:methylenetetrahydrofolate dehydrogenase (NADP+) / methenyltetrahydrofolate cyclohydrolase